MVHLIAGLVFGAVAVMTGVLMDLSFWPVVGLYVLGSNVGLLAGIPADLLKRRGKAPQFQSAKDGHSSTPVNFAGLQWFRL